MEKWHSPMIWGTFSVEKSYQQISPKRQPVISVEESSQPEFSQRQVIEYSVENMRSVRCFNAGRPGLVHRTGEFRKYYSTVLYYNGFGWYTCLPVRLLPNSLLKLLECMEHGLSSVALGLDISILRMWFPGKAATRCQRHVCQGE